MKRVEIVAAQAIQQDIIDALALKEVPAHYTLIPTAFGKGCTDPKLGDSVWPEENFIMIIYCEQPVVYRIAEAIELVKQKYDHEGIGFFIM
ncbi:MAG: hypothetical protein K9M84_14075 [Spirochaetia bacterium]|jgi:hypothetical protein|nr:hypothetical protein [Spirochaetia bacterium]MCF7942735.1 hypothetical protein [Spirochaetia bacterium]